MKRKVQPKVDITFVLNFHEEGVFSVPAIKSAVLAAQNARDYHNLVVDVIAVMDCPNTSTVNVVNGLKKYFKSIHRVHSSDPGIARNRAIEFCEGKYVAFLDGDDLTSPNWLYKAYYIAEASKKPVIVHPEVCAFFGQRPWIFRHQSQSELGNVLEMLDENSWTALSFARKETFEKNPFRATEIKRGYGYEDWHWNCEMISRGYSHVVAPETAHFIRQKRVGSQLAKTANASCVMKPTRLIHNFAEVESKRRKVVIHKSKIEAIKTRLRSLVKKRLLEVVHLDGALKQLNQPNLEVKMRGAVVGVGEIIGKLLPILRGEPFTLVCLKEIRPKSISVLSKIPGTVVAVTESRIATSTVHRKKNIIYVALSHKEQLGVLEMLLINIIVQIRPKKFIIWDSMHADLVCEMYRRVIFEVTTVDLWSSIGPEVEWPYLGYPNYRDLLSKTVFKTKPTKKLFSAYYS